MNNVNGDKKITLIDDLDYKGRFELYSVTNAGGGKMFIIYDNKRGYEVMSCCAGREIGMLAAFCREHFRQPE